MTRQIRSILNSRVFQTLSLTLVLLVVMSTPTRSQAPVPSSPSPTYAEASLSSKPASDSPKAEKKVPTHVDDELALLRLRLLLSNRALAEANFKLLAAEAQKTQNEFESLTRNFNQQTDALYAKLGLERSKFEINLENGEITPVKK